MTRLDDLCCCQHRRTSHPYQRCRLAHCRCAGFHATCSEEQETWEPREPRPSIPAPREVLEAAAIKKRLAHR